MRNVDATTITAAFLATLSNETAPRTRELLTSLAGHLHAFAKETKLSHEEWRNAIGFLVAVGRITTEQRNEFVLLSDVLGLSSLVDMLHSPQNATPSSVLGPFHILGAPDLPYGGDLQGEIEGETAVVSGRVADEAGRPVAGALIEVWQTAPSGLYSNQDPGLDPMALRGRFRTRDDGTYLFSTTRPSPYMVPTDGPVGDLLRAMGRHAWRPAHFHFIVEAEGRRTLVTELFPKDDSYIDSDAVFGVREPLLATFVRHEGPSDLPQELAARARIKAPWSSVRFDVTLATEPKVGA